MTDKFDIPHDALLVLYNHQPTYGTMLEVFDRDMTCQCLIGEFLGNILVTDEEFLLLSLTHSVFKNADELIAYDIQHADRFLGR